MTSASSMHDAWHSELVLWDNPEGWAEEGGEGAFRMGGHIHPGLIHVWQKPPQYCN